MLGEWVGWRRWTAIGVGFVGVLVVTRPGLGGIHPAALLSLGSAICYALYAIIDPHAGAHRFQRDHAVLFQPGRRGRDAAGRCRSCGRRRPIALVIALMVAIGALGSFGHYLLIAAHRLAPASVLSPFIYTQIVWATALGYLVFGDVPNRWTSSGAAIVVASGLYLLHRERRCAEHDRERPRADRRCLALPLAR